MLYPVAMSLLSTFLDNPYQGYAYGYPHKLTYREIAPALSLAEVWQEEKKDSLFFYLHLPFCEMRCGFCNLFTTANPDKNLLITYLEALKRQMSVWSEALGSNARMVRCALGGGTPTFLSEPELENLFILINSNFDVQPGAPFSIEMSPGTITREKLQLLLKHGMTRASVGVQSFHLIETKQLGRPQEPGQVHAALKLAKDSGVQVLNIDLIYGIEGQSMKSWRETLTAAVSYLPEEIYLYPLYVRPLTGMDRIGRRPTDQRTLFYREARLFLEKKGYYQISMRLFRLKTHRNLGGPVYCCQEDGMIGLGAGARSYTRRVHFSTEYAVGQTGIREIISSFNQSTADEMARVNYGTILSDSEQKRRYILKSLLRVDGLDLAAYQSYFGSAAFEDFPELHELESALLAQIEENHFRLNANGLELSDAIGPWLYSPAVANLIQEFELK